jgi:hypothetical protein
VKPAYSESQLNPPLGSYLERKGQNSVKLKPAQNDFDRGPPCCTATIVSSGARAIGEGERPNPYWARSFRKGNTKSPPMHHDTKCRNPMGESTKPPFVGSRNQGNILYDPSIPRWGRLGAPHALLGSAKQDKAWESLGCSNTRCAAEDRGYLPPRRFCSDQPARDVPGHAVCAYLDDRVGKNACLLVPWVRSTGNGSNQMVTMSRKPAQWRMTNRIYLVATRVRHLLVCRPPALLWN